MLSHFSCALSRSQIYLLKSSSCNSDLFLSPFQLLTPRVFSRAGVLYISLFLSDFEHLSMCFFVVVSECEWNLPFQVGFLKVWPFMNFLSVTYPQDICWGLVSFRAPHTLWMWSAQRDHFYSYSSGKEPHGGSISSCPTGFTGVTRGFVKFLFWSC